MNSEHSQTQTVRVGLLGVGLMGSAMAITPAGLVMGRYNDVNGQPQCFLRHSTIAKITIPGAVSATPWAINPAGDIVGVWADAAGNHSFLRAASGSITAIDVAGATYTQPVGLNAAGQITGYYSDANGHTHGFLRS